MNKLAVSLFISQSDDGIVHIKSLAAEDFTSKAIARMLTEQAACVVKYVAACDRCVDELLGEK